MMRWLISTACAISLAVVPFIVHAKPPSKITEVLADNYPVAEPHRGLETAHDNVDSAKLKGYVVIERGGIPAERARFFISWDEYDYRGVVIHIDEDEKMTTRRGSIYTYLQPGDVMAIADVKEFNGVIYFKLISADVYIPETRQQEKRHSRVTVMLGFKFSKEVFKSDDAEEVLRKIGEWLKPFSNVDEAKAYARGIKDASQGVQASKASKASQASKTGQVNEVKGDDEAEIKSLEQKVEEARRQLEEAEEEIKKVKQQKRRRK